MSLFVLCQPRYRCNAITATLAYAALAYAITSVVYLVIARTTMGTPFKDSLTEDQRRILAASKAERRRAFCIGVAFAVLTLGILRPLA